MTWANGDTFTGRMIHMRMKTNRMRFGDLSYDFQVRGVTVRAQLRDSEATTSRAWIQVKWENPVTGTSGNFNRNPIGDPLLDGTNRYRTGGTQAHELQLVINVIGEAHVAIKDIVLELDPPES